MLAAAAAQVTAPATVADFNQSEGADLCAPWMFDSNGAAIRFPAEVIGFRARYWPTGARGPGELVEDDDGGPVFIPRNATPEEFRALVGYGVGRYKLAALDPGFQFIERLPLVVVTITPANAARANAARVVDAAPAAAAPSDGVIGQVLAFAREATAHTAEQLMQSNARALEQIATLQRDQSETQRQTAAQMAETQRQATEQLATVVGSVAAILAAAGTSGLVKKTTALDAAAAGAPVTVQMMPANANDTAAATAPRNAASATTAATAATAAAAAEKGAGMGDALVALGLPIVEKLGTVLAYGAAKKLDVPDDYARSVAGVVQSSAQIAAKMMQPDAPPAPPAPTEASEGPASTVGVAARVGRELMAHVFEIQRALSEDDRGWVMQQMAARPGLLEAFKPAVAAITVDEGMRAVAALRAMDGALTTVNERAWFDRILTPRMLPTVFRNLFITAPIESAIDYVRERAALGLPID